jgi:hypothetical protein
MFNQAFVVDFEDFKGACMRIWKFWEGSKNTI